MKKFLFQLFLFAFLIGAILWMFLVIGTAVLPHDNPIRPVITSIFNLPYDFEAKPYVADANSNAFEKWLYGDFIYNFYSFATVVVIFGLFTLTRGRNAIEKYMLLQAYALPRQRDHWGKIIDAKTSEPISFAVVRVLSLDKDNQEHFVAQTVADLDGRYRIYLPSTESNYIIEVKSPGFITHRGEFKTTFLEADGTVTINIPLKRESDNIHLNPIREFFINNRIKILKFLTGFIFLISLTTCLSSIYTLTFHTNWIAFWNFVFYGLAAPWNLFVILERRQFKPGRILNYSSKAPISGVTIKIDLAQGKPTLLSDKSGVVKFDVDAGQYSIHLNRPGFVLKDNKDGNLKVTINKDGYLEHDIFMIPLTQSASASSSLQNPFA